MARLSKDILEEGKQYVLEMKWDMLYDWMTRHKLPIRKNFAISILKKCMLAKNEQKAIKLFNTAFAEMDVDAERFAYNAAIGFMFGLGILLVLGAIGGFAFLIRLFMG